MNQRILFTILFSTALFYYSSISQVRPLIALTSEYTSGVPLFGVGAGVVLGQEGRFGIGGNYEFASAAANEDGVTNNYVGGVAFYNVFQQGRKSISLFARGGNVIGEDWIFIPGAAANYHFTEHIRGVFHFGFRAADPTVGFAVFISPFKRKVSDGN